MTALPIQEVNEICSFLEILIVRGGLLVLLVIYILEQIRKHWRSP